MPALRTLSGRECRAILEANGFFFTRQSGSHMMLRKQSDDGGITVSVPDHRTLKPGTLSSIIRSSQLPRSLFETQ